MKQPGSPPHLHSRSKKQQRERRRVNAAMISGQQPGARRRRGQLFIISGTSQVGKNAVVRLLKGDKKLRLTNIRTNTTRPRRREDARSHQYTFRTTVAFKKLIKDKALLEWARVHGYYYGTPRAEVEQALKKGRHVTLVIDVQGTKQVKKMMPKATTIFITAESPSEVKRRIMNSPHIPQSQKTARWRTAQQELKAMPKYDYIVINRWGKLAQTAKKVAQIIKRQEPHGKT